VPLAELDAETFSLPIATYTRSYFLTARMAARRMAANQSGVIMTVTSTPSRTGTPLIGGRVRRWPPWRHSPEICPPSSRPTGSAFVGLRPQGIPETGRIKESFEGYAKASVEFEVEDADAGAAAGGELQRAGFELLHPARTEPWGQTVTRLLTEDGLIVGISYAPAFHDQEPA
jgi:hypothetical protein